MLLHNGMPQSSNLIVIISKLKIIELPLYEFPHVA